MRPITAEEASAILVAAAAWPDPVAALVGLLGPAETASKGECSCFDPKPPRPPKNVPDRMRQAVYVRDGHACRHCGVIGPLSIDHVVPRSRGGSEDIDNLQTLCVPCNRAKGTRTMDEWLADLAAAVPS